MSLAKGFMYVVVMIKVIHALPSNFGKVNESSHSALLVHEVRGICCQWRLT